MGFGFLGGYRRAEKSTKEFFLARLLCTEERVYYWRSRAADFCVTDWERETTGRGIWDFGFLEMLG